jgi:hypothetical protein
VRGRYTLPERAIIDAGVTEIFRIKSTLKGILSLDEKSLAVKPSTGAASVIRPRL